MGMHAYQARERIVSLRPPVRDQSKPRPYSVRRIVSLRREGALEKRYALRVREGRIDEIEVAEMPGRRVPFTLQVIAQNPVAIVVLRTHAGHVLHGHVVE